MPYVPLIFFRKSFFESSYFDTNIRNGFVTKAFIDKRFRVYNGSKTLSFIIVNGMVGKKLGEFSITKVLGRDILVSKDRKAKAKKKQKRKKK